MKTNYKESNPKFTGTFEEDWLNLIEESKSINNVINEWHAHSSGIDAKLT